MGGKATLASTLLSIGCAGVVLYAACTMQPGGPVIESNEIGGSSGTGASVGTGGSTGTGAVSADGSTTLPDGAVVIGQDDPTCTSYTPTRAQVMSPTDNEATSLVSQMTQQEKIDTLSGGSSCNWRNPETCYRALGVSRLGIPDYSMRDGPRGVHQLNGAKSTTWAVAEARAASFDTDLEYRVGVAQGEEMRAGKYDLALGPVVNTLRHPAWGRAHETYGEDPVLLGEMGAAYVRGMQQNVGACPKHWVANDTDNNRNTVIAFMDEQTLRENYAKPFQIIVEKADPACIMAAYNGVNSYYCAENTHILTDILRTDWKWNGFVVSDWGATKGHGAGSLNAGLDCEMPSNAAFSQLPQAVQLGDVKTARIEEAATRILNSRTKLKELTDAYKNSAPNPGIVNDPAHQALARETEEKGAVLLKNDGILPLGSKAATVDSGSPNVKSIIILGPDNALPTADVYTTGVASGLGDRGSSNVEPPYAVSYFQGLSEKSGITVTQSANAADAAKADVAIIPVAMAEEDEGEGADRQDLTLAGVHPYHWIGTTPSDFIKSAATVNPNIVVLLTVGSAILVEDWIASAKGIVQTFYSGQEAGHAVAKLLFGDINFSGKLPFTVAQNAADYPAFQNTVSQAHVEYLHGYRKIEAEKKTPRFWFGFGLSYTTYEYSDLKVLCSHITDKGRLNVQVTVKNTGNMAGDEIVELYVGYPKTTVRRPPKELKAFTRVSLQPGEAKVVPFNIPAADIAYWSSSTDGGPTGWTVEKVEHTVLVGPSADPTKLLSASFTIQ